MITVRTPYSIVGADYSAQEVRVIASLADDKEMIKAYEENKDLYAVIGTKVYHNDYYSNLEFLPTLVSVEPQEAVCESQDGRLKLLVDDEVELEGGSWKPASQVQEGDCLRTSEGPRTVREISGDSIYMSIRFNKNY